MHANLPGAEVRQKTCYCTERPQIFQFFCKDARASESHTGFQTQMAANGLPHATCSRAPGGLEACSRAQAGCRDTDALGVLSEVREGILSDDALDVVYCQVSPVDCVDALVVAEACRPQPRLHALPESHRQLRTLDCLKRTGKQNS